MDWPKTHARESLQRRLSSTYNIAAVCWFSWTSAATPNLTLSIASGTRSLRCHKVKWLRKCAGSTSTMSWASICWHHSMAISSKSIDSMYGRTIFRNRAVALMYTAAAAAVSYNWRWPTALWLKVLGCPFTVFWLIWVLKPARHQPLSIGSYESRKVFCARVNARKKWLSSNAMCGQEVRAMAPTLILIQTLFPLLDNFVTSFRSSPSFLTNHSTGGGGQEGSA